MQVCPCKAGGLAQPDYPWTLVRGRLGSADAPAECPSENGLGVSTVKGGTVHKMEKVRMFLCGYKCMCVHACAYL